jgi:hypothetical protein
LLAAQVVHAAGESSAKVAPGTYAVVLAAGKVCLEAIEVVLRDRGVAHSAIRENDGEFAGEIMAIGVMPERRSKIRRLFSSIPLLK